MFSYGVLLLISLAYLGLLFAIAYYGDRTSAFWRSGKREPVIYALSLAIYCTSWTFYGSVGRAATVGMDFLLIYIGPVLLLLAGYPVIRKILIVARAQNVTSIADFIGARYGKSRFVAATATTLAFFGVVPYIALQLQAAAMSFDVLVVDRPVGPAVAEPLWRDTALLIALAMAFFSILFGVRHVQSSERHQGMILAIAFESLVKLGALLAVGLFVVYELYGGPADWLLTAFAQPDIRARLDPSVLGESSLAILMLSTLAFICLPRQFHVAVVESGTPNNLRTAAWLFPLYLFAINLFVPVLAAAGLQRLGGGNPDLYVLALPMASGEATLSLLVFIGGLSAATSMVIVASVALSTMISTELVMPLLLRRTAGEASPGGIGRTLLAVRRATIMVIFLVAYLYYAAINGRFPLASIGLISFCAVAQFGPALFVGLFWRGAHRNGAFAGMVGGALVWAYALFLPSFRETGLALPAALMSGELGPFRIGQDQLTNGVFWSLLANILLLAGVSMLSRQQEHDRRQARAFVDRQDAIDPYLPLLPGQVAAFEDLKSLAGRLLGVERAEAAFAGPIRSYRESELADFTERLLSGAIGAASARIMVAAATQRGRGTAKARRAILDDASQAILFNRDLLRAALENVSMGIGMFDADEKLAAWNQRLVQLLGLPEGLVRIGTPVVAVLDALSRGKARLDLAPLAAGLGDMRRKGSSTLESRRSDGRVLEFQVNSVLDGGFVLACTDITGRVRALEALRDSERRIRVYTDNVPVLIAYADRSEHYRFTNRQYEQALGLTREQTGSLSLREALGEERYGRLKPLIDAALAGERQTFEIDFPTIGIELARGTYIPHLDENGEVIGFITLYQDITDQRRAETVLREANEILERRVAERTRELTVLNAELERAREVAVDANLGKTRFLAAATHDLLQPLHAARLFTATLLEGAQGRPDAPLLAQLDQAQSAVEQLLQALLEISKLDAGALVPEPRLLPVDEILSGVVASFEPVARNRGLRLRHVRGNALVNTDPTLLRRVVQNFVSNAVRYTRRGGVLVGYRRRGGQISIEVWDTGPGIPADRQREIFEEFRRLEPRDGEQTAGLGLGLAIVDRIAKMLGLPVTMRSVPGRGSMFAITLPLAGEAHLVRLQPAVRPQAPNALAGKLVLCVENDDAILAATEALLRSWSCGVLRAANAAEALKALAAAERLPDLVLLDYHLDGSETGLALLDRLRTAANSPLPAILVTADRSEEVRVEAADRAVAVLHKPARPASLRALMTRMATSRVERASAAG